MDRAKAKSLTRTVQIVAIGLVGAGVAAAFVPLTGEVQIADTVVPPLPPKPPEPPPVEVDTAAAALALNSVSPPVKNQPKPEEAQPEPTTPVLTGVDAWRYLGAIVSAGDRRAIVVINDQQRMLKVGQTVENVEVVQVERGFVKVKQGEIERQIDLAARQKPELTIVDPAVAARAGANRGASMPSANPPGGAANGNAASVRAKMAEVDRLRMDAKRAGDARSAAALESAMTDLEGSLKESDGKGNK